MYNFIFKIVNNKHFTHLLTILLILGIIVNILPYFFSVLTWSTEYSNQIMLGYVCLGMIFLFFKNRRLMIISLLCAGILTLFLKETTSSRMKLVERNAMPEANLLLCNLDAIDKDQIETLSFLTKQKEDVLICQQFNSVWKKIVDSVISAHFKHKIELDDSNGNGVVCFSNLDISYVDTFYIENVPILYLSLADAGYKISLYTLNINSRVKDQVVKAKIFNGLTTLLGNDKNAKIIAGNFNMVMWSAKLQDFVHRNDLNSSRNGYYPNIYQGTTGFFNKPVTHIFFSGDLENTLFKKIRFKDNELGIQSNIQFANKVSK